MKRAAYPSTRQFVVLGAGWLLLALAGVIGMFTHEGAFLGFFALVLGLFSLGLAARAAVVGDEVRLFSVWPRRRLRANLRDVVRYVTDDLGRWYVETESRRVRVPVDEPWELHAAIAERIPECLDSRRLRIEGAAPHAEYRGLWTFDAQGFLSDVIGRVVAVIAVVALTRQPAYAYGLVLGPLVFGIGDMFGRIDATDEGLVRRGPFHRRSIPWDEATAIFCERPRIRRRFVLTSAKTSIEIPAHLAIEAELMRKVLLSLPEGILCVNFDETTFRGYRKRKEKAAPAREEPLLPILTS